MEPEREAIYRELLEAVDGHEAWMAETLWRYPPTPLRAPPRLRDLSPFGADDDPPWSDEVRRRLRHLHAARKSVLDQSIMRERPGAESDPAGVDVRRRLGATEDDLRDAIRELRQQIQAELG